MEHSQKSYFMKLFDSCSGWQVWHWWMQITAAIALLILWHQWPSNHFASGLKQSNQCLLQSRIWNSSCKQVMETLKTTQGCLGLLRKSSENVGNLSGKWSSSHSLDSDKHPYDCPSQKKGSWSTLPCTYFGYPRTTSGRAFCRRHSSDPCWHTGCGDDCWGSLSFAGISKKLMLSADWYWGCPKANQMFILPYITPIEGWWYLDVREQGFTPQPFYWCPVCGWKLSGNWTPASLQHSKNLGLGIDYMSHRK